MAKEIEITAITRSPKGTEAEVVKLEDVAVPDLWHVAMWVNENAPAVELNGQPVAQAILDTWHLAHDLLHNLRNPHHMTFTIKS